MKLIATADFSQGPNNPLGLADNSSFVKRGRDFSIGDDLPFERLSKEQQQLYTSISHCTCLFDSDEGRQILAEIERAKTPRERHAEEFKTFDRLELFKMNDKELAEWQSRYAPDEPQWRLAEHEWQRRLTEQSIRATVSAARVQAWFGIAAALIGALGGALLTLLIQRWSQ